REDVIVLGIVVLVDDAADGRLSVVRRADDDVIAVSAQPDPESEALRETRQKREDALLRIRLQLVDDERLDGLSLLRRSLAEELPGDDVDVRAVVVEDVVFAPPVAVQREDEHVLEGVVGGEAV